MKLPVISGKDAVKTFEKPSYVQIRQTGSHIRMKHRSDNFEKPITIPNHGVLGKGLLRKFLRDAEVSVEDFVYLL